jgi:drug/metabolite transporter (DMT)-like permease
MAVLCVTGAAGHYCLLKAYEVAEASAIQPFAYFQIVFASAAGLFIFGETLRLNVVLGGGLIIAAGLFALWRERVRRRV